MPAKKPFKWTTSYSLKTQKPFTRAVSHKQTTQSEVKSTGVPPYVVDDTKYYNLILHRYKKSERLNTIWGVIYEHATNNIISYTIERVDMVYHKDRPTIKPGLHPITPGGSSWPSSAPWHKGPSRVVAEAARGRFGYGSKTGQALTMMRIGADNGCLFHPGRNKKYSEGCILIGEKADENGVRPSWDIEQFHHDNIMSSINPNVRYYKTFVNSVIKNLEKGKSPQIFVVEKFNEDPRNI